MQDNADRMELACPLNGKLCIKGHREDFPKDKVGTPAQCRWWVHVQGKDPQSEKMVDLWDCSVPWLVTVGIETSQMVRQDTATVDKLKNIVYAAMPTDVQKKIDRELPVIEAPALALENKNGTVPGAPSES